MNHKKRWIEILRLILNLILLFLPIFGRVDKELGIVYITPLAYGCIFLTILFLAYTIAIYFLQKGKKTLLILSFVFGGLFLFFIPVGVNALNAISFIYAVLYLIINLCRIIKENKPNEQNK